MGASKVFLKTRFFIFFSAVLLSFAPQWVQAEATAILPKGVRTVLYRYIQAESAGQYQMDSRFQSYSVNQKLNAKQIAKLYKPARDIVDEVNAVQKGLGDQLDFGRIEIDPEVHVQAHAFALGWGLGAQTMVVGVLPIWDASVELHGGYIPSDSFRRTASLIREKARKNPNGGDRASILAQVLEGLPAIRGENLQSILVDEYGYKPLGSWSAKGIGDAQIFFQTKFIDKKSYKQAVRYGAILPTGRVDDPDNLVDVPFGKGYYSTYLESLHDVFIWRDHIILSGHFQYQYNWEATKRSRIVYDREFPLSKEKTSIRFKPGDAWSIAPVLDVRLYHDFRAWSSYRWEGRGADRLVEGPPNVPANAVVEDSPSSVETAEFGLKYSTVRLYRAGRFAVPMDVSTSLSRVVSGRNTEKISMAYGELNLYF